MPTPTIERYAMTQREKIIEEFYIGLVGRIIAAKDDENRKLRSELKRLADYVDQTRENCQ
jgi:hypothetical protein